MGRETNCECDEYFLIKLRNTLNHPKYENGTCLNICTNCQKYIDTKLNKELTPLEIREYER